MSVNVRKSVTEQGTINFEIDFYDETDAVVIPPAIDWTLTDDQGTIVNARHAVSVAVPAATINITLTGSDTAVLSTTDSLVRLLYLNWTYNSSLGAGLQGHEQVKFMIVDLKHPT
jgi:hypothetical protein